MKKRATPSAPEAPAWEECEICRDVPAERFVYHDSDDKFPPAVYRLEEFEKYQRHGLLRCPLCLTFYLKETESDPHHFMGLEDERITRIDNLTALRMLASMDSKKAGRWMTELDADARIPELVKMLETDGSAEAAATLAKIYQQRGEWDDFEALLRHRDSTVRGAALAALTPSLERAPPGIIDAFVTLLGDKANALAAHKAFTCGAWWGKDQVSPLIITLVECLENDKAEVRAFAVDLIFDHLAGARPVPPTYEPGKPPKLGKAAKTLSSQLPLLVRHIVKPLPARWPDIAGNPGSDMAREFPKKLNTGIGALRVLEALIDESKAGEARVRKALSTARPQLLKIFSSGNLRYRFVLATEAPILGQEARDQKMKQKMKQFQKPGF